MSSSEQQDYNVVENIAYFFSSEEAKSFFDELEINSPALPENMDLFHVGDYLFSNFTDESNFVYFANWQDINISYQELDPNAELPTNFEIETESQIQVPTRLFFGFSGHGFTSWNFIYHYQSPHLALHIYVPLLSPLSMENSEEKDLFLESCYKVIELCLSLEKTPNFFNDSNRNKLCLMLTEEKTEFLVLDKNNFLCAKGQDLDDFFNFIGKHLEVVEENYSDNIIWLNV